MRERLDAPAPLGLDFDLEPPIAPPAPASVLTCARRRPRLVALALLLALAAALAAGLARAPVYTATARMRVAGFDVSVPGALTGYATTAVALAATYSFSIDEPSVVGAVARELRVPRGEVAAALSASPLPQSPVFRVRAEAAAPRRAVALANAGARALARERLGIASAADRAARLRAFRRAAAALATARAGLRARQADAATTPAALARAEADVAAAQVALDARRSAYLSGAQSTTATPSVQLIAPARAASGDRGATLELLLVVGLAAGLAAGLALAVLAERRAVARRP